MYNIFAENIVTFIRSIETIVIQLITGGEDGGTKKREGGRKKDFKKKDKDKGYRMFEQEDSEEERLVSAEETK